MRKQIAAANWKMNLTVSEAEKLTDDFLNTGFSLHPNQQVVLGVPFPYLINVEQRVNNKPNVFVAAQNCSDKSNGAYTGEVSVAMLKSIQVTYVIIGHSERREYNHEDNALLAAKVDIALANGIKPIFCCGEPLQIRESEQQNGYVETQLKESLFHLDVQAIKGFVIAYEPIWAIGTGRTASSEQAQQMHAHIRKVLAGKYGEEIAATISILYGGSVKAANAVEIFGQPDVDGGLVGGASLIATEFAAIINSLKK